MPTIYALQKHDKEGFEAFYAIYSLSFPPSEQKSKEALLAMLTSNHYTIFVTYETMQCIGFCIIFHPLHLDFYLLEYMATHQTIRGKGIGSILLTQSIQTIYQTHGQKPLLIEIDSPEVASEDADMRAKREQFYRKIGCLKLDPFDYILGLKSTQTPPAMELLVYHPSLKSISKKTLQIWLESIYTLVYDCEKDDERIAQMLLHVKPTINLI